MAGKIKLIDPSGFTPEYRERWMALKACVACERRMTPPKTRTRDWPGTVSSAARGLCTTCYARARAGGSLGRSSAVHGENVHKTEFARVASFWSESEKSCALLVCEHVEGVEEASEILQMLGLFDDDRFATEYLFDPKLALGKGPSL